MSEMVTYPDPQVTYPDPLPFNANAWLISAANSGNHDEVREALVHDGANVNHRDCQGCTALMHAACCGCTETVIVLLLHGADVTLRDVTGYTARRCAQEFGYPEIEALLRDTEIWSKRSSTRIRKAPAFFRPS